MTQMNSVCSSCLKVRIVTNLYYYLPTQSSSAISAHGPYTDYRGGHGGVSWSWDVPHASGVVSVNIIVEHTSSNRWWYILIKICFDTSKLLCNNWLSQVEMIGPGKWISGMSSRDCRRTVSLATAPVLRPSSPHQQPTFTSLLHPSILFFPGHRLYWISIL